MSRKPLKTCLTFIFISEKEVIESVGPRLCTEAVQEVGGHWGRVGLQWSQ